MFDSLQLALGSQLLRTLVSPFRNTEFLLFTVKRVETLNVLPRVCLWDKVHWLSTQWTRIPSYSAYKTKQKFRLEIKSTYLTNRTIEHGKNLPRTTAELPSLEILKSIVTVFLRHMLYFKTTLICSPYNGLHHAEAYTIKSLLVLYSESLKTDVSINWKSRKEAFVNNSSDTWKQRFK